jgi:hypothetical protein
LLRDTERAADLGPGVPRPPGLIDVVREHRIAQLAELLRMQCCGLEEHEGFGTGRGVPDLADELVE